GAIIEQPVKQIRGVPRLRGTCGRGVITNTNDIASRRCAERIAHVTGLLIESVGGAAVIAELNAVATVDTREARRLVDAENRHQQSRDTVTARRRRALKALPRPRATVRRGAIAEIHRIGALTC